MSCSSTHPATERGQELIELAILLPLLLVIAFGVLDLGRLYHAAITITNAAREGARYGTFFPEDASGIINATRAEAQASSIDLSTSVIQVSCPEGCGSGLSIRVTVSYNFHLIMGLVLPDPNLELIRSAEMMVP
ncbi:MAG TPA: pilus assembly protein [Anaerolineae bacterium]|nr:pilus assembly protein [Anaerolineae bacterium]